MKTAASEGNNIKGLQTEARRRLRQMRQIEKRLQECALRRDAIDEAMKKHHLRAEELRTEVARLVDVAGGSLSLSGFPKAVYVKENQSVEYDLPKLVQWLGANAPGYTTTQAKVDRSRLRGALEIRGGRAWLKGAAGPVEGVRVRSVRSLVIPRREEERE